MIPVDPMRMTFGQMVDQETLDNKVKEFGLDQSSIAQTWKYIGDLSPIHLSWSAFSPPERWKVIGQIAGGRLILKKPHWRTSYQSGRSVWSILRDAWPPTFLLALSALTIGLLGGLIMGCLSVAFLGSWLDKLLVSVSVLGYSVPSYVSALFFSLFFGFFLHDWTGLHPQGSIQSFTDDGIPYWNWSNLLLPAMALGIRPVAVIMQITRSSLSATFRNNYIVTAKAKGLTPFRIWTRHALPNAANPIISTTTSWLAALLAGAFFVETIFNYHGIGSTTIQALVQFDIPVLMGCITTVGILLVLVNMMTDVIYTFFDPRIRLE